MAPSINRADGPEEGPAGRRRYGHLCPIALALDVVGDRWDLLLLRELFAGPKRFTDLAAGLPGVGTAVLSERLHRLEHDGLVSRRRLGPPTPAHLYQLTARGWALDPVLTALAQWGSVYLAGRGDLTRHGRWLLQAMAATITTPQEVETTNFILDGEESHVRVAGERLVARDGLHRGARVTVRGRVRDLYTLVTSRRELATPSRRFVVEGDRGSADRLLDQLLRGIREAVTTGVSQT